MAPLLEALLIGVIAGLRTATAPAAVSWAARLGWLKLGGAWAAFMGAAITPIIFTVFALAEYVVDLLPQTPSRKTPPQFGARIVSGGFCGTVVGTAGGAPVLGGIAGVAGAVIGTLGGSAARSAIAKAVGRDWPAALIEDAVAILGAFWIVFPGS